MQVLRESQRTRRLLAVILASGSFCLVLRTLAAKLLGAMLYHPFRYQDDPQHSLRMRHFKGKFTEMAYQLEEVNYALPPSAFRDGLGQSALLVHPQGSPTGGLWLLFGGNAMVATDWLEFCESMLATLLAQDGQDRRPAFLLIDYPGYGHNDGAPSPRSVLAAQLAGLRAALPRLAAAPGKLHLLGHSLGAAAAAQLAAGLRREVSREARHQKECTAGSLGDLAPGRLVLSAPFLNIDAMAQAIFGKLLLPSWLLLVLLTERWNNAAWVPQAASAGWSVSIILGSRDEIVPAWMGRALRDTVRRGSHECGFVEVKAAGHNDIIAVAPQEYAALMGLAVVRGPRGAAL